MNLNKGSGSPVGRWHVPITTQPARELQTGVPPLFGLETGGGGDVAQAPTSRRTQRHALKEAGTRAKVKQRRDTRFQDLWVRKNFRQSLPGGVVS